MTRHLEIVVTVNGWDRWFGEGLIEERRFKLRDAQKAEKYFYDKSSTDNYYKHTTIKIVEIYDKKTEQ